MKKLIIAAVLASTLPFSFAMAGTGVGGHDGGPKGKHQERFAQEVGLTDAQKTQIEAIKTKYNTNRKAEMDEIQNVLTPEQKEKAKALHEARMEKFKEMRSAAQQVEVKSEVKPTAQ